MKNFGKNIAVVILILLGLALLFSLFAQPFEAPKTVSLTQLTKDINEDRVEKIEVADQVLAVSYTDGSKVQSRKETEAALSETLTNLGVEQGKLANVEIANVEQTSFLEIISPFLFILLPILFFVFFFFFIFRQARAGLGQAFDFTRSKARLFGAEGQVKERVSFKDVAGLKEAKEELYEVVDFLKNPRKYLEMGAKIPRGVLLVGAPGTGKTLLARAVASEAGVPFFSASGSEFVELFVGVGSSRVRDLFGTAKKAGRAIIFIDELDAIGRMRGMGFTGGHEEREQTLNQILVEMDGFDREDGRIVLSATNRPDVLDPALLRPGRFDRRIILDLPDVNDREEILKIHSKGKPLAENTKLREIAERTPGFAGADLANLMNEAAILAARHNKTHIAQDDLTESIEKVLLGPERKSHVLSRNEKEVTAYHEAGHALVSSSLPFADPVRKISIISRGRAGGYTLKLPEFDKHLKTKAEFLADLATLMGGYVAEKLVFKDVTTGASNNLQQASELARKLVKEFGMSEKFGPVTFGRAEGGMMFPGDWGETKPYSDAVAADIDQEVAKILEQSQKTAERVLKQRKGTLAKIAKVLIEKETIERDEFEKLIAKQRGQ
ncbi:MAG: cell division protein FtsH [Candidatus Wildermuthbacteria bacterium RIFCSPLOWO2_01_FULL_48_16]|uniref:ATP-dependent zinc metalloprotease FtsH n=1 Tax=Candidatus Wildermuthbacteria bacterium RIFCSPLOWO2_01_FULL_48_16 TaxID=1802461 RepID=A0A1G2RK10_9BACT|nr:MAG: cell division protein FtsH [Candidatus Wildermuthbacteria bacterium RIFCSPLOWO2_01_FULL_48_16]